MRFVAAGFAFAAALAVAAPTVAQVRTEHAWVPVTVEVADGDAAGAASAETTARGLEAVRSVFGPPAATAAPRVRRCGSGEGAVTPAVLAASFSRAQEQYYRGEFEAVRDEIVGWLDALQSGCRPLSSAADAWADPGPVGALHHAGALLLLGATEAGGIDEAEARIRRLLATFAGTRPTDSMFPPSLADRYLDVEPDETEVGRVTVEAPGCEVNVAGRAVGGPVRVLAGDVPVGIRCDGEAFVVTVPVAAGASLRVGVPASAASGATTTTERTLLRIAAAAASLAADGVAVALDATGTALRVAAWGPAGPAGVWTGTADDPGPAAWLATWRGPPPGASAGETESEAALWGAASLIVGGALLGGGGAWALADAQQRLDLSYSAVTVEENRRLVDDAAALDATGWALVGLGAAAVAGGAVWLAIELAGGAEERPEDGGIAVRPLVGPASAGLQVRF